MLASTALVTAAAVAVLCLMLGLLAFWIYETAASGFLWRAAGPLRKMSARVGDATRPARAEDQRTPAFVYSVGPCVSRFVSTPQRRALDLPARVNRSISYVASATFAVAREAKSSRIRTLREFLNRFERLTRRISLIWRDSDYLSVAALPGFSGGVLEVPWGVGARCRDPGVRGRDPPDDSSSCGSP